MAIVAKFRQYVCKVLHLDVSEDLDKSLTFVSVAVGFQLIRCSSCAVAVERRDYFVVVLLHIGLGLVDKRVANRYDKMSPKLRLGLVVPTLSFVLALLCQPLASLTALSASFSLIVRLTKFIKLSVILLFPYTPNGRRFCGWV